MRVIAGSARSLRLKTISDNSTRPTTDKIKETLFNMLQNDIYGCYFLDLFSGSGAIGIEALSRGADEAVFVEQNSKAMACIKENLNFTKLSSKAKVYKADVLGFLDSYKSDKSFDFIFMDPPYNKEFEKRALSILSTSALVNDETIIIIEASIETDFSYSSEMGFTILKRKIYKTNCHVFLKKLR